MRLRLHAAVRALLADPAVAGLTDASKLAAVVLFAKSRAPQSRPDDNQTSIWAAELGRWLGVSASMVHHRVLPAMRGSDALHTRVVTDAMGHPTGLDCLVMPLWRARSHGGAAHPLALAKVELATLLRLLEALFGPGWAPEDREATPAGLLAGRTGRGAATDRLALLLMVLDTRASGWLKLCGGSVDKRQGRGAATLARLLGCSPSGARKVLARLTQAGVVARPRKEVSTRMLGKGRVMLLPVARAYGRNLDSVEAVQGAGADFSAHPDGAFGDHAPAGAAGSLGGPGSFGAEGAGEVVDQARPSSASLHADHAPVAYVVGDADVVDGFSGEAEVGASHRRPQRAGTHEDGPVVADASAPVEVVGGPLGPLRGDQQLQSHAAAEARQPKYRQGLVPAPPLDLMAALDPVMGLWWRLDTRGTRNVVVAAARRELTTLAGLTTLVGPEVRLAERLRFRLEQQGSVASVTDPAGWLIGRGLRQRSGCGDIRCDDAVLVDSGNDCPRCEDTLAGKRAMRRQVLAQVVGDVQGADWHQVRVLAEARLRDLAALAAEDEAVRRGRARQLAAEREAATEQQRARARAQEEARQMVPCRECGREQAAGLCGGCEDDRAREQSVMLAVDTAVAAWADLEDHADIEAVAAQTRTDIQTALDRVLEEAVTAGALPQTLARLALLTAQDLASEYHGAALAMLAAGPEASTEARLAREARMRGAHRHPTRQQAQAAAALDADSPRDRAAQQLLADRLAVVRSHSAHQLPTEPAVPEPVRAWICACHRSFIGVPPASGLCVPCEAKAGLPGAGHSARRRAQAGFAAQATA